MLPLLACAAYVALWFAAGFLFSSQNDLATFFWPSAQIALSGHLLLVYTHAVPAWTATGWQDYPNANGPLSLGPLVLVGLVLRALGQASSMPVLFGATLAVFSLVTLALAGTSVRLIGQLRGSPLPQKARWATYAFIALAPPVWQALLGYGHIEVPLEALLIVLALRTHLKGSWWLTGALLGLAILDRSTAVLFLIPFAFALMRRPLALLGFLTAATLVAGVGFLPFYVASPAAFAHSLITFRASLPIYAGSVWTLLRPTALAGVGQHYDLVLVALLTCALSSFLAFRPLGLTPVRLVAALALAAACFTLLAKTVWPYYFFEVFIFITIFSLTRITTLPRLVAWPPAWLLAPLAAVALSGLAEVAVAPGTPQSVVNAEAAWMFICLSVFMALLATAAARPARPAPELASRFAHPPAAAS
jgi:hypothetical protein